MIQSRVNEDARIVPGARLDADGFVNLSTLGEVLGGNGDS